VTTTTPDKLGRTPVSGVSHTRVPTLLLAVCALGSLLLIGWLLHYSAYGFDFTDEGFYLYSMANPRHYDYSHTQFGFVYHPLYTLLGGDIVALRRANIVLTFGLAWGLSYVFLAACAPTIRHDRPGLMVVAAGLATSILLCFDAWLITPNYNNRLLKTMRSAFDMTKLVFCV